MDRIVPSEGIDVGSIPAKRTKNEIFFRPESRKGVGNTRCFPVSEGLGKPGVSQEISSKRTKNEIFFPAGIAEESPTAIYPNKSTVVELFGYGYVRKE